MTMVELIVVIAVLVVLAGMILPVLSKRKVHDPRISCLNRLRQVGIGFRLYANDMGSNPQFIQTNEAWVYFQTVGKEIGSPKVLLCPDDPVRSSPAIVFESPNVLDRNSFSYPTNRNNALGFFYGTEAEESNPGAILAGDRHITRTGGMISGVVTWKTNSNVSWAKDIHKGSGNAVLADGSGQMFSSARLRQQLPQTTNAFVRFVLP